MKNLIIPVMFALLVLTLASCGGSSSSAENRARRTNQELTRVKVADRYNICRVVYLPNTDMYNIGDQIKIAGDIVHIRAIDKRVSLTAAVNK